ncbi:MAG TPA: sulfite exporter TauE/SafE family protein [Candidatus Binatia bacterium]|nr:sulfite exporter TauE/SafE family protein [Candidatus Binatia bacterium]
MPAADPAPGRSPRQASGRSPARDALALALAAVVAVLLAAFVKGAIGFGFPTLGTPLLALAVDVKTAVALLVIPNLVMDGLQLRRSGPLGDAPRRLAPLLVFTMVGTVIGTKLLVALSGRAVTLILGGFVLGFVVLDLVRFAPRVPASWERALAAPVGLVAGIMGGITNAPGTVIALYFVALGMDKRQFVRSIAFTFLVVKTVQLATLVWYGLLGWHLVLGSLGLSAAGVAGFGLGLKLQDRLDQRTFNRAVLLFLSVLGVWLVVRAL